MTMTMTATTTAPSHPRSHLFHYPPGHIPIYPSHPGPALHPLIAQNLVDPLIHEHNRDIKRRPAQIVYQHRSLIIDSDFIQPVGNSHSHGLFQEAYNLQASKRGGATEGCGVSIVVLLG